MACVDDKNVCNGINKFPSVVKILAQLCQAVQFDKGQISVRYIAKKRNQVKQLNADI